MQELAPGREIGDRYVLERVLGRGGMGEVWRAADRRLAGRPVAIKVLRSDLARDPTCSARFVREAIATSRVTHPNLVGLFDVSVDADPPYLVMEYVVGRTVSSALNSAPMSMPQAVLVAYETLRALAALHAKGIVHRDIKPGNVMLARDGERETVKVVDLGIAQLMTGTAYHKLTSTGAIVGTPMYMAPEMLRADATVGPAADVWAVGILLYACLTRARPWLGSDLALLVHAILGPDAAPDVRTVDPSIPDEVARLVATLLEKSTDRRPRDASEALRLFSGLPVDLGVAARLSSLPSNPTPRPSSQPPPRESEERRRDEPPAPAPGYGAWARKHRWALLAAAGMLGGGVACGSTGVVFGAFAVWFARGQTERPSYGAVAPGPASAEHDAVEDVPAELPGMPRLPVCQRTLACCFATFAALPVGREGFDTCRRLAQTFDSLYGNPTLAGNCSLYTSTFRDASAQMRRPIPAVCQ